MEPTDRVMFEMKVLIDAFPGLESNKALLNVLSLHGWLIALAFIAVVLTWFVLNQTRFGLRLRFVGEEPQAVDTAANARARLSWEMRKPGSASNARRF